MEFRRFSFRRMLLAPAVAILFAVPMSASAADSDSGNGGLGGALQGMGNSVGGYVNPLVTVFGAGMNSGWASSAKPFSLFNKLPVGFNIAVINMPLIVLNDEMKTFDFQGKLPVKSLLGDAVPFSTIDSVINDPNMAALWTAANADMTRLGFETELPFSAPGQPTVFGADSSAPIPITRFIANSRTLYTIEKYNEVEKMRAAQANDPTPDTVNLSQQIQLPFKGIGSFLGDMGNIMPSIPSVTVQVGISKIPVIDNFTLGLRLLPPIKIPEFGSVGQFGMMAQYEFLHLIPVAGSLPFLNASTMFAFNNFKIEATDQATLSLSNWIAMVNGSADVNLGPIGLGGMIGLGIERSNMKLKLNMEDAGMGELNFDLAGDNKFRFTIGPRITLACLEIYGDVILGSVTAFNVGVSLLTFNGHGL